MSPPRSAGLATSPFSQLLLAPENLSKKIQQHLSLSANGSYVLNVTKPSSSILSADVNVLINGNKPTSESDAQEKLKALFLTMPLLTLDNFLPSWNPAAFKELFADVSQLKSDITLNIRKDKNDLFFVDMRLGYYDEADELVEHCEWSFRFDPDNQCFIPSNLYCSNLVLQELLKGLQVVSITDSQISKSTNAQLSNLVSKGFRYVADEELTEEQKETASEKFFMALERSDTLVFGAPPFAETHAESPVFNKSKEYKSYEIALEAINEGHTLPKTEDEYRKEALDKFLIRQFGKNNLANFYAQVILHFDQGPSGNPLGAILEGANTAPFTKAAFGGNEGQIVKAKTTGAQHYRIFLDSALFHLQSVAGSLKLLDPNAKLNWDDDALTLQDVTVHSECYFDNSGSHFMSEKITGPLAYAEFTKNLYLGTASTYPSESASLTESTDSSPRPVIEEEPPILEAEDQNDILDESNYPVDLAVVADTSKSFAQRHPYWTAFFIVTAIALLIAIAITVTVLTLGAPIIPAAIALVLGAVGSTVAGSAIIGFFTAVAAAGAIAASAIASAIVMAALWTGFVLVSLATLAIAAIKKHVSEKSDEAKNEIGAGSHGVMRGTLEIDPTSSPRSKVAPSLDDASTLQSNSKNNKKENIEAIDHRAAGNNPSLKK